MLGVTAGPRSAEADPGGSSSSGNSNASRASSAPCRAGWSRASPLNLAYKDLHLALEPGDELSVPRRRPRRPTISSDWRAAWVMAPTTARRSSRSYEAALGRTGEALAEVFGNHDATSLASRGRGSCVPPGTTRRRAVRRRDCAGRRRPTDQIGISQIRGASAPDLPDRQAGRGLRRRDPFSGVRKRPAIVGAPVRGAEPRHIDTARRDRQHQPAHASPLRSARRRVMTRPSTERPGRRAFVHLAGDEIDQTSRLAIAGVVRLVAETRPAEIVLRPLGGQQRSDRPPEIRRAAGAGQEQNLVMSKCSRPERPHEAPAPDGPAKPDIAPSSATRCGADDRPPGCPCVGVPPAIGRGTDRQPSVGVP